MCAISRRANTNSVKTLSLSFACVIFLLTLFLCLVSSLFGCGSVCLQHLQKKKKKLYQMIIGFNKSVFSFVSCLPCKPIFCACVILNVICFFLYKSSFDGWYIQSSCEVMFFLGWKLGDIQYTLRNCQLYCVRSLGFSGTWSEFIF